MKKGKDPSKDQSYVLYGMTQEQLSRLEGARNQARNKGINDTLILLDDMAFIVIFRRQDFCINMVENMRNLVCFVKRYLSLTNLKN